jgi:hypothetical protein
LVVGFICYLHLYAKKKVRPLSYISKPQEAIGYKQAATAVPGLSASCSVLVLLCSQLPLAPRSSLLAKVSKPVGTAGPPISRLENFRAGMLFRSAMPTQTKIKRGAVLSLKRANISAFLPV